AGRGAFSRRRPKPLSTRWPMSPGAPRIDRARSRCHAGEAPAARPGYRLAMTNLHAPVDLAAYCERIGHRGSLAPTLETLRTLQALHPAAIPFEAIDVLLGLGVDIAPQAVDAKLI